VISLEPNLVVVSLFAFDSVHLPRVAANSPIGRYLDERGGLGEAYQRHRRLSAAERLLLPGGRTAWYRTGVASFGTIFGGILGKEVGPRVSDVGNRPSGAFQCDLFLSATEERKGGLGL
jgi:hypothetical protein